MASLTIAGLGKRFGIHIALENINLAVGDGEFLTLLGPSGCGKSTLLSIIAGLERPTEGSIVLDREEVQNLRARDRDAAMIFQSYALYPNMNVAKNISFGLKMRGVARAERDAAVKRVAEMLHITPLLERKPYQLSGGQRQRVAMGRALVRNPKLFLFDEPLSNLDAQLRAEMRVEIKRLHQRLRSTIVYVTHDQIEAMTMSTKIVVMNLGRIMQIGTPDEIYSRPNHVFVARFVGAPAMNFLPGRIVSGRSGSAVQIGSGTDVEVTLPLGPHAWDSAALGDGREVLVGVRPEAIAVSMEPDPKLGGVMRTIEIVEPTGADTLVVTTVAGKELTARLPANVRPAVGKSACFSIDPDALHLFDLRTEQRIDLLDAGRSGSVLPAVNDDRGRFALSSF